MRRSSNSIIKASCRICTFLFRFRVLTDLLKQVYRQHLKLVEIESQRRAVHHFHARLCVITVYVHIQTCRNFSCRFSLCFHCFVCQFLHASTLFFSPVLMTLSLLVYKNNSRNNSIKSPYRSSWVTFELKRLSADILLVCPIFFSFFFNPFPALCTPFGFSIYVTSPTILNLVQAFLFFVVAATAVSNIRMLRSEGCDKALGSHVHVIIITIIITFHLLRIV